MYKKEAQFLVATFNRANIEIADDGDISLSKRTQDNDPSAPLQATASNSAAGVLQRLLQEQGTD